MGKRRPWGVYLMESLGLGIFLLAAGLLKIALYHPASPINHLVRDPAAKNAVLAFAMFPVVLYGIVEPPWGKRSGAHINPVVTLVFWRLDKISGEDAVGYVAFQFLGGLVTVALMRLALGPLLSHPAVDFNATKPGADGPWAALAVEFTITLGLLALVLWAVNDERLEPRLGPMVAGLIAFYLLTVAPYSGMSLNPARSLATGVWSDDRATLAIYFVAPTAAALLAAGVYRRCWPTRLSGPSYPIPRK